MGFSAVRTWNWLSTTSLALRTTQTWYRIFGRRCASPTSPAPHASQVVPLLLGRATRAHATHSHVAGQHSAYDAAVRTARAHAAPPSVPRCARQMDADDSGVVDLEEFIGAVNRSCRLLSNDTEQPRDAVDMLASTAHRVGTEAHKMYGGTVLKAKFTERQQREQHLRERCCFFAPMGNNTLSRSQNCFRQGWNILQFLALSYVGLIVPIRVCFAIDAHFRVGSILFAVDVLVDLSFLVDIFIQFRCGHAPTLRHSVDL